jgi:poly-beta-1,6-N-acetyl-D-glucosamine biosynthesis protein PgaD
MNPNDRLAALAPGPARLRGAADLTDEERSLLQEVAQRARTPLIIERPEGLLTAGKLTNYLLTFVWWSVWGHFMVPLITLLLWMSGFRRLSDELLGPDGLNALLSRLPLYSAVVGILCGGLIGWALLNWWRFADRERRQWFKPISSVEVARDAALPAEQLARWQAEPRLVVVHDESGRPIGVTPERPLV